MQRALSLIKQAQEESLKLVEEERQRRQEELQPKHKELQQEVADAQQGLDKASAEVRENEQEMEAMRADRQMSDFIKQRQASTVYTKHLAVIAQAREDFEKLSMLLAKEKEDAEKGTPAGQKEQLLEDWEREYMKKLYRFIPSPRAARRFVNVYWLLRASIDDQKLQAFIGNKDGGQHQCVLLLLAMLFGHPAETTEILGALLEGDPSETWWNFIDSFNSQAASTTSSNNGTTPDIKSRAAPSTPSIDSTTPNSAGEAETEGWRQLSEKLEEVRSLVRKDQPCKDFVVWTRQVARYSYQSRMILFAE